MVRAARDAHHGQQAFRGWSGFPGLRPAFPNSSNVPRRIAISMSSFFFSRRCRSPSASSYLGHLRPQREHPSAVFRHRPRTTGAGAGRNGESSTDTSSTTMPLTFSNRLN